MQELNYIRRPSVCFCARGVIMLHFSLPQATLCSVAVPAFSVAGLKSFTTLKVKHIFIIRGNRRLHLCCYTNPQITTGVTNATMQPFLWRYFSLFLSAPPLKTFQSEGRQGVASTTVESAITLYSVAAAAAAFSTSDDERGHPTDRRRRFFA